MEPNWKLVYTVNEPHQAAFAKQLLDENGIVSVVINKDDSSFQSFGFKEIYVSEEFAEKAKTILQDSGI